MDKTECAEVMKGALKALELWDEANLNQPLHLGKEQISFLRQEGATAHNIKTHGLGTVTSNGQGAIIIPQAIEEAIYPSKGPGAAGGSSSKGWQL